MAVWTVHSYDIYECPIHGEFSRPLKGYSTQHDQPYAYKNPGPWDSKRGEFYPKGTPMYRDQKCPWQERDGWGNRLGQPCNKKATWLRHQLASASSAVHPSASG